MIKSNSKCLSAQFYKIVFRLPLSHFPHRNNHSRRVWPSFPVTLGNHHSQILPSAISNSRIYILSAFAVLDFCCITVETQCTHFGFVTRRNSTSRRSLSGTNNHQPCRMSRPTATKRHWLQAANVIMAPRSAAAAASRAQRIGTYFFFDFWWY